VGSSVRRVAKGMLLQAGRGLTVGTVGVAKRGRRGRHSMCSLRANSQCCYGYACEIRLKGLWIPNSNKWRRQHSNISFSELVAL